MQKKEYAVIDADIYIRLTEYEYNPTLFLRVIEDARLAPVFHEYVFKHELAKAKFTNEVEKREDIHIYNDNDYLLTVDDKKEYERYFRDVFETMTDMEIPSNENIYTYTATDENLGEIRSAYMALKLGIPYFISDDGKARNLIRNYISSSQHIIRAFSLEDLLQRCRRNGSALRWKDLKASIVNGYGNDSKHTKRIYRIMNEGI